MNEKKIRIERKILMNNVNKNSAKILKFIVAQYVEYRSGTLNINS